MAKPKPIRERVLLIVEAEGQGPPLPIRLRRFLKTALRAYGIRCRWIQDAAGWTFGDELHQTEPLDLDAVATAGKPPS